MKMKSIEGYNSNLLYIGYIQDEYLFNETSKNTGWSLIGLRTNTEDELRKRQREIEPEDLGYNIQGIEQWFDYEAWYDSMEEDWENMHDVQAEFVDEETDGEPETYYLGFGLGTSIEHYFKENKIIDFKSYKGFFDEIGLNKKQFNKLYNSNFDIKILEKLFNETF